MAYDQIWAVGGGGVQGFDQFTGELSSHFGFGSAALAVQPYEGNLTVACEDKRLYQVDLSDPMAQPQPLAFWDR